MSSWMPIFVIFLDSGELQPGSDREGCLFLLMCGLWVYDVLLNRPSLPYAAGGSRSRVRGRAEERKVIISHASA